MKDQFSDEQMDQMIRSLLNEAAVDDATVNEIADSPKLWWGVQRQIAQQKPAAASPWPPSVWRMLFAGAVPAFACLLIAVVYFSNPFTRISNDQAKVPVQRENVIAETPTMTVPTSNETHLPENSIAAVKTENRDVKSRTPVRPAVRIEKKPLLLNAMIAKTAKAPEFKSDFIALSYARDAESGQIVRVKVPSSMMVSLGLVQSVNKSSDLVDAEVILGDDGLTRAIRFIR